MTKEIPIRLYGQNWGRWAAVALFGAGLLHLPVALLHAGHAPLHALFLMGAGTAEIGWAALFWRHPTLNRARIGTLLAGTLLGLWLLTRVLPTPLHVEPEQVDLIGLLIKSFEMVGLAALVLSLVHPAAEGEVPRASWRGVGGWLLATLLVTVLSYGVAQAATPAGVGEGHEHGKAVSTHDSH